MNTLKLELEALALSDWSVRAGYGLTKHIDSAVIRDSAGLPYLPAKTLVGVIRKQATQIAASLDEEIGESRWTPWITYVFGSEPDSQQRTSSVGSPRELPRPAHLNAAALRMTTATRALEVAQALGISVAELRKATTLTRASTSINDMTGTTETGSLRVEERARAGTKLRGQWSLGLSESASAQDVWPALFLLASALKTTRYIGGKRRRGAGEFDFCLHFSSCPNSLEGNDRAATGSVLKWLLEDLKLSNAELSHPPSAPQIQASGEEPATTPRTQSPTTQELRKIGTLLLTTVSPLISSPTKKGTVVSSSNYISGATILGLAQRSLGVPGEDIRDSNFIVTHAYPTAGGAQAQRSIPWPLALVRSKGSKTGTISNKFSLHEFDPKLKPCTDSFIAPVNGSTQLAETTVAKVSHTHASIKPGTNPELFEYRAIEAGLEFAAEIWWDKDPTEIDFPPQARLGTSHKDDYGLTKVQFIPAKDQEDQQASPDVAQLTLDSGAEFNVVLTSDVLLLGSEGNPAPTAGALLEELEDCLDLEHGNLTIVPPTNHSPGADGAGKVRQTLIANVARHESWQVSWGLPRPTLIGLAAGSVMRLKTAQPIGADALQRLNRGIGFRTAEGYGRVLVNPAFLESATLTASLDTKHQDIDTSSGPDIVLDNATRAVVLQAVLLDRVSQISLLSEQAASLYLPVEGSVTNTQLNQLRKLSQAIGTSAVTAEVRAWADKNRLSSQQKDQLLKLFSLTEETMPNHPVLRELDIVGSGENAIYETSSSDIFAAYCEAISGSSEDKTKQQDLLKTIIKSVVIFLVKTAQKSANERN